MRATTIALLAIALFATSCKKKDNTNNSTTGYPVTYNIQCSDCTVNYVKDQAGNIATETHKNSSWEYTFNGKAGQVLTLNVTNTTGAQATIDANISWTKDGTFNGNSSTETVANGIVVTRTDTLL